MIEWLKEYAAWICPCVLAICAVLTLIHTYFHKDKKGNQQTIGDVKNSNIVQAGGDVKKVQVKTTNRSREDAE